MNEPKYTYTPQRLWADSEGPSQWVDYETFNALIEAQKFCNANFDHSMNVRIVRREVEP